MKRKGQISSFPTRWSWILSCLWMNLACVAGLPPANYFYTDFTGNDLFANKYIPFTWPNGHISTQGTPQTGPKGYGAQLAIEPFLPVGVVIPGLQGYNDMFKGYVVRQALPVITLSAGGFITVDASVSASTSGTASQPFGPLVTKPEDDPRLANCQLVLFDDTNKISSAFMWTNEGIWATHERYAYPGLGGTVDGQPAAFVGFSNWNRVANRSSYYTERVQLSYSLTTGLTQYFLNDTLVQVVQHGVYPAPYGVDVGLYVTAWNSVITPPVEGNQFSIIFGCGSAMDKLDPWNPTNPVGLMELSTARILTLPETFYLVDYQPTGRCFGQGATILVNHLSWNYS